MKKKYKRILFIAGAIILIASMVVYGLTPLTVAGIQLNPGTYREVIREEGVVIAQEQWNIYPPQSLNIDEIYVQAGDQVQAGALLLKLDDSLARKQLAANDTANANNFNQQLTSLRGELLAAQQQKELFAQPLVDQTLADYDLQIQGLQIQLTAAQKDLARAQDLYEAGVSPKTELDAAELAVQKLENSIAELRSSADLQHTEMDKNFAYYTAREIALQEQIAFLEQRLAEGSVDMQSAQITHQKETSLVSAPIAGRILFLNAKKGDLADINKPVAAISDEHASGVEVYLLATEVRFIQTGMAAQVVINSRQKEYHSAVITAIEPYATEKISSLGLAESRVKVTLALPNNPQIIVGQKVDVEFTLATKDEALAVPKAAVFEYAEGYAVLAVNEKKAQLRVIEKEFETDTHVVIRSGLQAQEIVLLTPKQEGLKEGTSVSVNLQ